MRAPLCECSRDCYWYEYADAVPPRYRNDESSNEGSGDGDMYTEIPV